MRTDTQINTCPVIGDCFSYVIVSGADRLSILDIESSNSDLFL